MNYFLMPGLKYCEAFDMNPMKILETVCAHFELSIQVLISKTRKREIVVARMISFHFMRNHAHLTLKATGEYFGGLDHTTVRFGIKTIENLRAYNEKIDLDIKQISNKLYL